MNNSLLGFIIICLVVMLVFDMLVRKKYNIDFEFHPYRTVNSTHKWLEMVLMIIFLISVLIAAFTLSYEIIYLILFGYFTVLASVRAYMEYKKGIKEEKEYTINFVWAIGYSVIFIGIIIF